MERSITYGASPRSQIVILRDYKRRPSRTQAPLPPHPHPAPAPAPRHPEPRTRTYLLGLAASPALGRYCLSCPENFAHGSSLKKKHLGDALVRVESWPAAASGSKISMVTCPSHSGSKGVTLTMMPKARVGGLARHTVRMSRGIRKYSIVSRRERVRGDDATRRPDVDERLRVRKFLGSTTVL